MRNILILFLFLFGFYATGFSQIKYRENRLYKTWITINKTPFQHKGYIHHLNDSSLVVTNSFSLPDIHGEPNDIVNIGIQNIEIIKIRSKGSIARGAIFGGLTGLVIGSVIAITDKSEGGDVIRIFGFYAVPLTTIGTGIGILFGAKRTKITISGNPEIFNSHRKNLKKISME